MKKMNRRNFLKKIGVVSACPIVGTTVLQGSPLKVQAKSVLENVEEELRTYMRSALTYQLTLSSRMHTIINEEFVRLQMGHVFATICDRFREAKVIKCEVYNWFDNCGKWGYVVFQGKYYVGEDFLCDVKSTSFVFTIEGKATDPTWIDCLKNKGRSNG